MEKEYEEFGWTSVDEVAAALFHLDPDRNPLEVDHAELRDLCLSLPGFRGRPERATEDALNAIRRAWREYFLEDED